MRCELYRQIPISDVFWVKTGVERRNSTLIGKRSLPASSIIWKRTCARHCCRSALSGHVVSIQAQNSRATRNPVSLTAAFRLNRCPYMQVQVPFFRPDIGELEVEEVIATLRLGWLTSGPKVRRFEEEFASA